MFLVLNGKIGRDLIDQVTSHIDDWNNSSDNCHVSLKAAFVLLAVGLQKPGPKSQAKDHQNALAKRLILWREGEISKLLRKYRIIQRRIGKLKGSASPDKTKVFAKLVLEGQINTALRFVSESSSGGVLPLTDDVKAQLKEKHPNPQPTKLGSLLFGPIDDEVPETLYSEINGEMVRQAAMRTKGAGGPSGIDANGFRRIMSSKSFKQSSSRLCETIATMTKILCTQYIDPSTIEPLFIIGGQEILSAEGTTQGDPLAMGLYALSIQPLITSLQGACKIKQCWFADDASGADPVAEVKRWWDTLSAIGPDFSYYPNGKKCWIITKPDGEIIVKEAFKGTAINVTVQGQRHLGAAVGSREYFEEYVNDKVTSWISEITKLAEFAVTQPQASYAAYTFGLKHRWTYFLRTLPDIQDLLERLESAISRVLIPAITDRQCGQLD